MSDVRSGVIRRFSAVVEPTPGVPAWVRALIAIFRSPEPPTAPQMITLAQERDAWGKANPELARKVPYHHYSERVDALVRLLVTPSWRYPHFGVQLRRRTPAMQTDTTEWWVVHSGYRTARVMRWMEHPYDQGFYTFHYLRVSLASGRVRRAGYEFNSKLPTHFPRRTRDCVNWVMTEDSKRALAKIAPLRRVQVGNTDELRTWRAGKVYLRVGGRPTPSEWQFPKLYEIQIVRGPGAIPGEAVVYGPYIYVCTGYGQYNSFFSNTQTLYTTLEAAQVKVSEELQEVAEEVHAYLKHIESPEVRASLCTIHPASALPLRES